VVFGSVAAALGIVLVCLYHIGYRRKAAVKTRHRTKTGELQVRHSRRHSKLEQELQVRNSRRHSKLEQDDEVGLEISHEKVPPPAPMRPRKMTMGIGQIVSCGGVELGGPAGDFPAGVPSITARKLADNEKKAPHESPVIVTGGGTGKEKKIYATRRKVGPSKEQAATMSSVAAESQANVVRAHLAGHTPDGLWASVKKKFCAQGVTTTTREETVRLSRGESSDVVGVSSAAAKSMSAASRPKPKQVELQPGMLVSQHV